MRPHVSTVGDAAKAAGVSPKAVRLYESKGLLAPVQRTAAGYRTYTDDDIAVLRFIRQAKTMGLSLAEIGEVLAISRDGATPCRHVTALLDRRLAEIDRAIAELRQLRRTLTETRARASLAAANDHTVCGIIEQ